MQLQLPDWVINLIILAIGTGIPVVYRWFTEKYIPGKQSRQDEEQAYRRKNLDDDREFHQQSESDAFKQVLALNEKLIDNQINLSNGRFDRLSTRVDEGFKEITAAIGEGDKAHAEQLGKVSEALNRMTGLLTEIKGAMGLVNRDWTKWNEIMSDIDQEMNTIKEMTQTLLIKEGVKGNGR